MLGRALDFSDALYKLQMKLSFPLFLRHSREGGNPSPALAVYPDGCVVPVAQVMDSRLRGNDEVGGFDGGFVSRGCSVARPIG